MTTRKIATSTLWQFSGQAVTMLLGILSVKFVTTALSQKLVGNYQTVYAYLQIFGILADFGLYAVGVKELSRAAKEGWERYATTFTGLFILRAGITFLSLGVAVLIAWILPAFRGTPLPPGIAIGAFIPFFTLLAGVLRMAFQVGYRMSFVFLYEVIGKCVPVVLMGVVLALGTRQSDDVGFYYLFLYFGAIGSFILFLLSVYLAYSRGILPVCPGFPRITTGFANGLPRFANGLPRCGKTHHYGFAELKSGKNSNSVCHRFAHVCQWFANGLPGVCHPPSRGAFPELKRRALRGASRFAMVLSVLVENMSTSELRRLLRLTAPFGFAFLAVTIYRQADVTLIALLRPDDYDLQNAYYGVALRIAEVGFLVPTFILNSALPMMGSLGGNACSDVVSLGENVRSGVVSRRIHSPADVFYGKLLLSLLTLGSVVSLFSFFWARPLVLLLTRESYLGSISGAGSDTALRLLSFSVFLGMIITFCFYLLLSQHKWKPLLLVTALGALLSVTLNIVLIPSLGFVGANITSVIVHVFLAAGLSAFTLRRIAVSLRFARFAKWLAFSVIFGVLLYLSAPVLRNEVVTLIAGVVGVGVACVLLSVFGLVPVSALPWRGQGRCNG